MSKQSLLIKSLLQIGKNPTNETFAKFFKECSIKWGPQNTVLALEQLCVTYMGKYTFLQTVADDCFVQSLFLRKQIGETQTVVNSLTWLIQTAKDLILVSKTYQVCVALAA